MRTDTPIKSVDYLQLQMKSIGSLLQVAVCTNCGVPVSSVVKGRDPEHKFCSHTCRTDFYDV